MKTKKLAAGIITMSIIVWCSSCVTTGTYTKEEKKMRNPDEKVYAELNNGKKISGSSISYPSVFKAEKSWIKIDDHKLDVKEMVSYQDKSAMYARFGNVDNSWIWVKQLKRGKINLYHYDIVINKSYYDGIKYVNRSETTTHFVFQKGNAPMIECNITEVAAILRDNPKALSIFTGQFGSTDKGFLPKQLQNHPQVIFNAIDIYNGDKN